MPQIEWLPEALEDLERLHDFLQEKDADAAARAMAVLREKCALLGEWPEMGRPLWDERSMRDLLIEFGNGVYVLRYRVTQKQVVVVRVWRDRETRQYQ